MAKGKTDLVTGATTELNAPTVEQVTSLAIQSYGITDTAIAELKADYGKLTIAGPDDKETYATANTAITRIRTMRTGIEAKRKEIKEPFLRAGQAIDAEAKRLTAEIAPIEEHLKAQVKTVDEEIERRKKAEEIRRVQLLTSAGFILLGQSYVAGDVVMHWDDITRLTEDQLQQTIARGIAALEAIKAEQERLRQAALETERKAKELADLEAQLAAKRRELEEMQAARNKIDSMANAIGLPTQQGVQEAAVVIKEQQVGATHYGNPRNWNSDNVYPPANNLPRYDAPPPPPANFSDWRQQSGFASQNEPAIAPPIGNAATGTPPVAKSVYFMDGWEAAKARIIKVFMDDTTPRKRSEWAEIFKNLQP